MKTMRFFWISLLSLSFLISNSTMAEEIDVNKNQSDQKAPYLIGEWDEPMWDDRYARFQERMNQLLDDFFEPVETLYQEPSLTGGPTYSPNIDVSQNKGSVVITAEVPGLEENDITITLRDNHLILEGEKKMEEKIEEENYVRRQRIYGSFYRTIPLPSTVDEKSINAVLERGVLTITLNKTNEPEPEGKQIPIQVK